MTKILLAAIAGFAIFATAAAASHRGGGRNNHMNGNSQVHDNYGTGYGMGTGMMNSRSMMNTNQGMVGQRTGRDTSQETLTANWRRNPSYRGQVQEEAHRNMVTVEK